MSLALSKRAELINGISGIRKSLSPGADIFPTASLEMHQAHSRHLCSGMQCAGYDGHDSETPLSQLTAFSRRHRPTVHESPDVHIGVIAF